MDLTTLTELSFHEVYEFVKDELNSKASIVDNVRLGTYYGTMVPLNDAAGILAGIIKGKAQK